MGSCGVVALSPACNWLALARKFVTRSVTFPERGRVKLSPLNATAFGAASCAITLDGEGPEPVSTDNCASTVLLAPSLFVSFTVMNTVKFPVIVTPGFPPEQLSTMSPTLSDRPSERTTAGTADGMQMSALWE